VFDDWFETVYADEDAVPDSWEHLCIFERFETAFEEGDPPKLAHEWLSPEEARQSVVSKSPNGRQLYQDLQSKDVKDDMSFQPPKIAPTREPRLPVPKRPPGLEQLSRTREKIAPTREPLRTKEKIAPTREPLSPSAMIRNPAHRLQPLTPPRRNPTRRNPT
jgi:hypothetical protein